MRHREHDALRQRRRTLLLGADDAVLLHAAEHIGQAFLGAIGMAVGIVKARPLEQAGEHGAFGQREVLRRFAEIAARRHLDAPGAAAEIDGIDIELENVVLAERAFQPRRHDHLADFSLVSDVVADQEVLHHLLRDGRAALRPAGFRKIADEGADDAVLVDAVMLIEAPVLGGDERLLHEIGHVGERHPDAAVAGLEHVGIVIALAVEHRAHAGQLLALEPRRVGQIGGGVVVERDHLADVDHRIGDGLVLAELFVGGIEVRKVQAVERLDVAADRRRIVERGRDQVVDIDRLDVERLAHMGAAVAQDLHHRVLILDRIELRLHRLRLGHDLAERQRRREELDENHIHAGDYGHSVRGTQSL